LGADLAGSLERKEAEVSALRKRGEVGAARIWLALGRRGEKAVSRQHHSKGSGPPLFWRIQGGECFLVTVKRIEEMNE